MIIQSNKVWIADQFIPAQVEMENGRIVSVLPHGTRCCGYRKFTNTTG